MRQKICAPAWVDQKAPVGFNRVLLKLLGYKTDAKGNTYREDGWCLKREVSCLLYCCVEIGFCIASIWSLNTALQGKLETLSWLVVTINLARFLLNLMRAIWRLIDSHGVDNATRKTTINKRYLHQAIWHSATLALLIGSFLLLGWANSRYNSQIFTPEGFVGIIKSGTLVLSGLTQVIIPTIWVICDSVYSLWGYNSRYTVIG